MGESTAVRVSHRTEMTVALQPEFQYYLENQDELVAQYNGKFIVIRSTEMLGTYDTYEQAYAATIQHHPLGSFLLQCVAPGEESYTETFHSRGLDACLSSGVD